MQIVSIEAAEQAFHSWRKGRNSRKEAIPLNLWDMAMSLYPRHKSSAICRRLGLSGSQFKQQRLARANMSPAPGGFVLAEANIESAPSLSTQQKATLVLQGGNQRSLSLCVSIADLPLVFPYFEALL